MKNISILLLISLLALMSCTGNRIVSSAISKYSGQQGVSSFSLNGSTIGLVTSFLGLNDDEKSLLNSIDKIKILTIDTKKYNGKVNLYDEFSPMLNRPKYAPIMNVAKSGNQFVVTGNARGTKTLRELMILVGGKTNAVVYLKGNFTPEMVKKHVVVDENGDVQLPGKLLK